MRPVRAVSGWRGEDERAGEALVRPDLCPFVKSILGEAVSGFGAAGSVDAWAGMYTCDMTRRLFQELERISGKPVFQFQLPATRSRESAAWFASSIAHLVDRLIDAGLASRYDPAAALAWELARIDSAERLRKAALSWSVPPLDLHRLFLGFHTEHALLPADGTVGFSPGVRVAVTGSVVTLGDDTVPATLQGLGAGYLPLGCTGLSGLPSTHPGSGSPEDLALASFADTLCIRNRPNSDTFRWINETTALGGCHGLVLKSLSFCDLWHTEKQRFKECLSIPVLVLNGDNSPGERERTRVRLQAFVETLEGMNA